MRRALLGFAIVGALVSGALAGRVSAQSFGWTRVSTPCPAISVSLTGGGTIAVLCRSGDAIYINR